MLKYHHNFELKANGLHVNEKFLQLGLSPDRLIYCDCHQHGVLELDVRINTKVALKNVKATKTFR